MRCLSLLVAAASLAGQSPRAPSCTEDKRSECWVDAANQPGCQFWLDDETPSWKADWSGECSGGLAHGGGTVTWKYCFWDNGHCLPVEKEESGGFLHGRRHGKWTIGPLDAAACHRWNTEMYFQAAIEEDVSTCLESGASPDARDWTGSTPLHHAILMRSELPVVETLLDAGADVNARSNTGETPLHLAATFSDDLAVVRALLAAGADVDAMDDDRNTPLHDIHGGTDASGLAQILIDSGADADSRGRDGYTPLHHAANGTEPRIVDTLLKAGAKVDARDDQGRTPLNIAVEFGMWTRNEKQDVVEVLLAAGADPMARDENGRTPMLYALAGGNLELYRVLLESGADPMATRDGRGQASMHHALFGRNPALNKILLEAGADVNARDNEGETPLHLAASLEMLEETRFLLAAGADLEARDNHGNTPLHAVFKSDVRVGPEEVPKRLDPISDDLESVEILIKAGANIEARNHEGNTPLHVAAKYIAESNGVVRGYSANLHVFNIDYSSTGPTPIRLHAGDTIRVLLAAGADPRARNGAGETPCDLYRRNMFLRTERPGLCRRRGFLGWLRGGG